MRWRVGILAVFALVGCSGTDESVGPTYWRDAKPVIDARCTGCHVSGGIAPFALTTYDDVRKQKDAIASAVASRIMPPWPPAAGCSEYQYDRSLSDAQIQTLVDWVRAGALEGDSADFVAPAPAGGGLSRVDRTLALAAPYTPSVSPDEYRCFILDWPETATTYVTGFGVHPGDAQIVHHVIAFLGLPADVATFESLDAAEPGPGYTCFGGPGVGHAPWIGAWAPGSLGSDFPAGTGIEIPVGSKIIVQIHYNTSTTPPAPDRTSVDFKIDPAVQKRASILRFADPNWIKNKTMDIPAGNSDVMHSFTFDPTPYMSQLTGGAVASAVPFTVYSAAAHMHLRGTRSLEQIRHASGDECLLDIEKWDFHWQGGYAFTKPKTFSPGDQLYLECHWNNSAANQPIVNGQQVAPTDLNWGEGTTDEMCLGGFYVTE